MRMGSVRDKPARCASMWPTGSELGQEDYCKLQGNISNNSHIQQYQ